MKDITEQDIKVFTEAVTDYFAALGEEAAIVRTFYLSCGEAKEPVGDMTGIITVSGDFRGVLHLPRPVPCCAMC